MIGDLLSDWGIWGIGAFGLGHWGIAASGDLGDWGIRIGALGDCGIGGFEHPPDSTPGVRTPRDGPVQPHHRHVAQLRRPSRIPGRPPGGSGGLAGSGLVLNLVTNPVGAFRPAGQAALERDWKRELKRRYGIEHQHAHRPVPRTAGTHRESDDVPGEAHAGFNPAAVTGLMCRDTSRVGWDGRLFDCDFNQMLDLPADGEDRSPSLTS